jgi:hypothetical protein
MCRPSSSLVVAIKHDANTEFEQSLQPSFVYIKLRQRRSSLVTAGSTVSKSTMAV